MLLPFIFADLHSGTQDKKETPVFFVLEVQQMIFLITSFSRRASLAMAMSITFP